MRSILPLLGERVGVRGTVVMAKTKNGKSRGFPSLQNALAEVSVD
jgi:hypothetical protein